MTQSMMTRSLPEVLLTVGELVAGHGNGRGLLRVEGAPLRLDGDAASVGAVLDDPDDLLVARVDDLDRGRALLGEGTVEGDRVGRARADFAGVSHIRHDELRSCRRWRRREDKNDL